MGLQVFGYDLGRLVPVHRYEALVVPDARHHGRLVSHQHADDVELGYVLAEYDETDGQRRGENEADRAPEPGPERDRDEEGDVRDARALAVEPRFQAQIDYPLQT